MDWLENHFGKGKGEDPKSPRALTEVGREEMTWDTTPEQLKEAIATLMNWALNGRNGNRGVRNVGEKCMFKLNHVSVSEDPEAPADECRDAGVFEIEVRRVA